MKDLLSNEEIDSLMEAFRSTEPGVDTRFSEIGEEVGEHETVVSTVDLLKPNRLTREHMRDFERMFDSSAKSIGATMSEQLRYDMQCDCVAVEQTRFGNWVPLVGQSAAIYILKAPPLKTPVFFSVTTNLLYGSVDRLLGGHGRVVTLPGEFSEAEFVVADAFMEPLFERLAISLEELVPLKFEIEDRFTNASLAHILPSQDVVLSMQFQTGGEYLVGDLRLAIPYAGLEPFLSSIGSGQRRDSEAAGSLRGQLADSLRRVGLNMSVNLGTAELSLRNLLSLRQGDVVPLEQTLGQPLVAPVEGAPKFTGHVGTVGSRLAFQVASVME